MSDRAKRARAGDAASSPATGRVSRLAVGVMAAVTAAALVAGCGEDHRSPVAARTPAKLPEATTYTTLKGLPPDTGALSAGDGTVIHPRKPVTVSAEPGGPPVAVLPSSQLGSPTWVAVVENRPGWRRVLLPSRPNHTTGWIATAPDDQVARSPYVIKVQTSARRLTLMRSGRTIGSWTVAVGAAKTPTPTGRTFLLASLAPAKPTYSPLILPVGAHSETLDTFGGGPGTVAFHGWPDRSVFGQAVTHGCVRVPATALKRLSQVPLGSPVLITS